MSIDAAEFNIGECREIQAFITSAHGEALKAGVRRLMQVACEGSSAHFPLENLNDQHIIAIWASTVDTKASDQAGDLHITINYLIRVEELGAILQDLGVDVRTAQYIEVELCLYYYPGGDVTFQQSIYHKGGDDLWHSLDNPTINWPEFTQIWAKIVETGQPHSFVEDLE